MAEFHAPKSDLLVMLTTFGLTVVVDLTVAIEVGMVMAAFLFMKRMAEVTNVNVVTRELEDDVDVYAADPNGLRTRKVPRGVEVYEINGPFFFGAAEKFKATLEEISAAPRVLIIRMRNVLLLDSTGMNVLRDVVKQSRADGTLVIFSDVHAQPLMALGASPLLEQIGEENLLGNIDDALNRAREHLGLPMLPAPPGASPTVAREQAH